MPGFSERKCPGCEQIKRFRNDCKTCGCKLAAKEINRIDGNTWTVCLNKTRISTLEEFLRQCNIDTSIWSVDRFIVNKWEIGAKDNNGKIITEPLYQIKAFLRKKAVIEEIRKEIEDLKTLAKKDIIPAFFSPRPRITSNLMLELNISDHHFGKLAWGAETGSINYDIKIASKIYNRAFDTLLSRAKGERRGFKEIWFVVGNDILHSDDEQGRTTKGTQVSTDGRYHKTFSTVRNLLIQSTYKLLREAERVKLIFVSGNHDYLSVWHLGDSLECYFHDNPRVVVDNSPRYYKYHQYGKVMLMFTHGDKGKIKDYPLMMATEQPEMFGTSRFREVHIGHTHGLKVEENHGVRIRTLSALCPPDAWHAENGFTGNLRSSEAFIWHPEEGLIGTVIYNDSDGAEDKSSMPKIERKNA